MTPRFNTVLIVLLALFGLPYYWLLVDNRPGTPEPKPVAIAQLRKLADAQPGPPPVAIQYEAVAWEGSMRNIHAAGLGLVREKFYSLAFRLDRAELPPILIGTGISEDTARRQGYHEYRKRAQARIDATLGRADAAILLSAGPKQRDGLVSFRRSHPHTGPAAIDVEDSRAAGGPYAVAPGVVVIPATSFRSDAQLAYVKLASGREYLFLGSLSPSRWNVADMRAPSRWITDIYGGVDRAETYSWLQTVRLLKRQAPSLVLVPGGRVPKSSGLQRGFPGSDAK